MSHILKRSGVAATLLAAAALLAAPSGLRADGPTPANQAPASLRYLWAKAYRVPPETTTEESDYFSLCEGKNGKIYIGTAAYGRNSYLVEFDPAREPIWPGACRVDAGHGKNTNRKTAFLVSGNRGETPWSSEPYRPRCGSLA